MSNIKFFAFSAMLMATAIFTTACTDANSDTIKVSLTENDKQQVFEIRETDHVYGNADAPITLFEYSDFECPYCRSFHKTAEMLVDDFDGDVNWVYRHFPLSFHNPAAKTEAEAAECAADQGGDDIFWEYAESIYSETKGNGRGIDKNTLVEMSHELGLNKEQFRECLDSGKYSDYVDQLFKEGQSIGVTGTPATFIYDHRNGESSFISGNQSFDKLKSFIQQKL
jgi:protein-disulfide isomerase